MGRKAAISVDRTENSARPDCLSSRALHLYYFCALMLLIMSLIVSESFLSIAIWV